MTTNFSQLMGELKTIEVELEILANYIDQNFHIYIDLSNNCINKLTELDQAIKNSTNTNINDIKQNLNNILQICKKELEIPYKNALKRIEQLNSNLNKISIKANSFEEKHKEIASNIDNKSKKRTIRIMTKEENQIINDLIKQVYKNLNGYEQLIEPIATNLTTIKEQENHIKEILKGFEGTKELIKLIDHLDMFVKKSCDFKFTNNEEYIDLLSNKLINLYNHLQVLVQNNSLENAGKNNGSKEIEHSETTIVTHSIDLQKTHDISMPNTFHNTSQLLLGQFSLLKSNNCEYILDPTLDPNLALVPRLDSELDPIEHNSHNHTNTLNLSIN